MPVATLVIRSRVIRLAMFCAAAGMLGVAPRAEAQTPETAAAYPSRNITFLVGFAPGGPTDVIARAVAAPLAEALGKPIVIENRAGAGGGLAAQALARAAPDGYTLGSYDIALIVAPLISANMGYDAVKDFSPIVLSARTPLSFVVSPSLPFKTVSELITAAKQKPDDLKLAHSGVGSPPHLAAAVFLQSTGTKMLLVPYRGAAPAIQDVVAGHVSMLFTAPSTSISLALEGKVRMLGVTGRERMKSIPDVPTLLESGVSMGGLDNNQWFGIAAPAGTPSDIVAKINAATNRILGDKVLQERVAKLEFTVAGGTVEEVTSLGRSQAEFWRKTLTAMGVKPE
jgi:tripartite-type tricarboxylate transporter receptor subunit TctC